MNNGKIIWGLWGLLTVLLIIFHFTIFGRSLISATVCTSVVVVLLLIILFFEYREYKKINIVGGKFYVNPDSAFVEEEETSDEEVLEI